MATLVIHAGTSDGRIASSADTSAEEIYAQAAAGNTLSVQTSSTIIIGQTLAGGQFDCYEGFVSFDSTGNLAAGDTVTAAVLSLYPQSDSSTTDFTLQARTKDWGAGLTTADWVAAASLSALTLRATYATASGWAGAAYKDLTSEASFPAAVTKNGITYLLLDSSRHVAQTEPTGNEYVAAYAADAAGTTTDPKLTITYTAAPTDVPTISHHVSTGAIARALWRGNGWK